MTRTPASAPPRPDLPFLRHRARVKHEVSPELAKFVEGHGHHPPASSSLDLSAPAPSAAASAAPVSSSLDLGAPTPAPAAPVASTSLDLSPAPAPSVPVGAPKKPAKAAAPVLAVRRVAAGGSEVLTPKTPTVTLTRLQSGIGALVIEAACSDAVGDLRLGAAYRLRGGATSVVQHDSGITTAPPKSQRPVILGQAGKFERLTIDLAQVRDLDRLAVYAFSSSQAVLNWGGTLVATTFGGSRVEMPMDGQPTSAVIVLLTIYNVDGELVLRAEPREPAPNVREACLAFGFDRITWMDPRTPVT